MVSATCRVFPSDIDTHTTSAVIAASSWSTHSQGRAVRPDRPGPNAPGARRAGGQTGTSPLIVTRWMTRCWSPKSPTTECWVDRLSQKPTSPAVQW